MAKKKSLGWAIAYDDGLYTGWWQTRNDAIGEHVSQITGVDVHCLGRRLSRQQAKEWRKRKQKGDKAVRVTISYQI